MSDEGNCIRSDGQCPLFACHSAGRCIKGGMKRLTCAECHYIVDSCICVPSPEANTSVEQTAQQQTHAADGWANDAHYLQRKIESLRHHVRALQMLIKGQHSPLDFTAFAAEVDAIDRALEAPLRESSVATKPEAK